MSVCTKPYGGTRTYQPEKMSHTSLCVRVILSVGCTEFNQVQVSYLIKSHCESAAMAASSSTLILQAGWLFSPTLFGSYSSVPPPQQSTFNSLTSFYPQNQNSPYLYGNFIANNKPRVDKSIDLFPSLPFPVHARNPLWPSPTVFFLLLLLSFQIVYEFMEGICLISYQNDKNHNLSP